MRTKLLILFIVILTCYSFPAKSSTMEMSVTSDVMPTALDINQDGQKILAGVNGYSLWLTLDEGESWQCLDQAIHHVLNETYIKVEAYFSDTYGDTIVALCSDLGIQHIARLFVSFDHGESFIDRTPVWTFNPFYANLTIDPFNNGTWLIQTGELSYITQDSGDNWYTEFTSIINSSARPLGIIANPFTENVFYSINSIHDSNIPPTSENIQIFSTSESPYVWNTTIPFIDLNDQLGLENSDIRSIIPLSNGNLLVHMLYGSDPFVTFDNNGNYVSRSGGDLLCRKVFPEDRSTPGRLFAIDSYYLYSSDDFGQTWTELDLPEQFDEEEVPIGTMGQSPDGSTHLLSLKDNGIYSTTDSGLNWTAISTFELPRYRMVYPHDENIYYSRVFSCWMCQASGSDELFPVGLPEHPDSTYSHMDMIYANGDTVIGSVVPIPTDTIPDFRLYKTVDGGNTWAIIKNMHRGTVLSCDDSFGTYLLNCQPTFYEISDDLGETWTQLPAIEIGDTVVVGKSTHYSNGFIYANITHPFSFQTIVYRYDIAENEWTDTFIPTHRVSFVDLLASPNGVFAFDNETVLFYGGGLWEDRINLPDSFTFYSTSCYVDDDSQYILVNSVYQGTLYCSVNDGYSWYLLDVEYPFGLNNISIHQLQYDNIRGRVWLGTGLGVFWFPVGDLVSAPEHPIQLQPADPKLFSNYPNPFNASTRVQYHLSRPGNVKLEVFDITGRLVKILQNTYQPAGLQSAFLDGTGLASGTYFIRLNTGTDIRNRRITLIK